MRSGGYAPRQKKLDHFDEQTQRTVFLVGETVFFALGQQLVDVVSN